MGSLEPSTIQTSTAARQDVAWYRSCRLTLVLVSTLGYVCYYLLRINLSMAIVCMVRDPKGSGGALDGNYSLNYVSFSPVSQFQKLQIKSPSE